MRLWINLFFLIVLFTLSGMAGADVTKPKTGGTLAGHLTVTAPSRPTPGSSNNGSSSYHKNYGATQPHPLPEQVVLYLKNVKGKFKPPAIHASLDQKYLQFSNRILPVLKGTTVDFTNHDPVYHNVFTNSQSNPFDLGRKQNGETVSVKMNHVEIPVKVYCEIHPKMKSFILVLQNPFFTSVAPGKDYEITGIPSGTYTLVAWHDYWEPVETKVRIKKGQTTVADITLDKVQE